MRKELIAEIQQLNPWLQERDKAIFTGSGYFSRVQMTMLSDSEWDSMALILIGPRQSGKTTLGKHISQQIIREGRFSQLLYLNCDLQLIREWIRGIAFLADIEAYFKLTHFILFIDEVQRLENPGLLLKAIVDLKLPIKLIASGSSQLEMKSAVQEYLTGRHVEGLILPLSWEELGDYSDVETRIIYGCYPQIVSHSKKEWLLEQLCNTYIKKDIIEILRVSKADVMEKLITLLAHSSGQLVNYQQLAVDCQVSIPTVQHYISILEQTYVIQIVRPFVGNKRQEMTSNPICYFVDNGFRNQNLHNFGSLSQRMDAGLLVENTVFQELYKFKAQHFKSFKIHYWRTKGGAEVDFVLYQDDDTLIPVEVKYINFSRFKLTRGYRSFIETYQPKIGFMITKNFYAKEMIGNCQLYCFPLTDLKELLLQLQDLL